jgi:hypothetical protein
MLSTFYKENMLAESDQEAEHQFTKYELIASNMLFDILVYYLESKIDCLQNISLSKE